MKAKIKRLTDLEVIPPDHATQLYKTYSAKGWNKKEPMEKERPVPKPSMLRDALCLFVDSGTRSKEDLLSVEFTMHAGDIENLVNLPAGWFKRKAGDVVPLTLKASDSSNTRQSTGGSVIPFSRSEK